MDAGRTTGADGKTVAPNVFVVHLNEKDRAALGDLEKALISELTDAAKQYASDEGFSLIGDVTVSLLTDTTIKPGKVDVHAEVKPSTVSSAPAAVSPAPAGAPSAPAAPVVPSVPAAPVAPTIATPSIPPVPAPSAPAALPPKKATLVLGDGTRVAVKTGVMSVGRSAESSLPLNDTNVSRKHAEIRSRGEGDGLEWFLIDLGSTNGTMLNGVKVGGEKKLKNGDALMFGSTAARFEVA